jgi:hypothetical protein
MSRGWIDIQALRLAIEEAASGLALAAGVQSPRVEVRVELPDARHAGRRIQVVVDVNPTAHMGPWEDN